MMMITQCKFGSMLVNDKVYTSDLVIYPDGRVKDGWWRKSGHRLALQDVQDLLAVGPDVIVVGTGIYGRMQLTPEYEEILTQERIESIALPTKEAAEAFNRLIETSKKVGGCFHLTC